MFSTLKPPAKSKRRVQASLNDQNSLGYDFALLGLRAREARVSVIRKAATSAAQRVSSQASSNGEQRAMLSQVATSTYRLLDPRKRSKDFERVQLCLFSEEELDMPKNARRTLFREQDALVAAELVDSPK